MSGPRWAEKAAEELEEAVDNSEMSYAEYQEEVRGLREEVQEEAQDAYNDVMDY